MRKIIITEEQYITYIVSEINKHDFLLESNNDFSKIASKFFNGCNTFEDCKRRLKKAIVRGLLGTAVVLLLIKIMPFGSKSEKDELLNEIQTEKSITYVGAPSFDISEEGLNHIKSYETCSLVPYYATSKERKAGKRTIGYGHVITSKDPMWLRNAKSITQEQADELFKKDIELYVNEYRKCINKLPKHLRNANLYTQGWIDAGISLLFNCGRKNFLESPYFITWNNCRIDHNTKQININDYNYTCSKIKKSCITQDGNELNGLVKRRNKESIMAQIK